MAAKPYISNYMRTAANFIIEGRRLCTVALTQPPRYPDRGHSPAVTKLLNQTQRNTTTYSIGILTLENW